MNTVNDILCCLNMIEFTDRANDDHFEKLRCVKRRLVVEFEDYIVFRLTYVLNINDENNVLFLTNELDDIMDKTFTLRANILFLNSFEHFVDCATEAVAEK